MKKFITHYYAQILIVFLWLALVLTNYRLGYTLTGWDNLHPEINPWLDISRSLQAVWQEYQGLGLLAGMAHGSDLVRQVAVLFLTAFLPRSLIRFSLVMTMLLVGVFGVRRLFFYIFARRQSLALVQTGANVAAIFYLLNLGTVQNFYVAFEPYYCFFATLPWLLYVLWRAWQSGQISWWAKFLLLSFLASPAYYIQTNYLVYAFVLAAWGGVYFIQVYRQQHPHSRRQAVINLLLTACCSVVANLFWLLPQAYFVLTGGTALTMNSQINRIATSEVTIANQVYANPLDILLLRGYWWHNLDYQPNADSYEYSLQAWVDYPPTMFLAAFFALGCLAGIYYCWTQHRHQRASQKEFASFLPLGVVAAFLLMVFLLLSNFLGVPVLSQLFRSPFTKVIASLSMLYSILVGSSVFFFINLHSKLTAGFKRYHGTFWVTVGMLLLMLIYAWPAFGGHFIYHQLYSRPPQAYERLFEFMATQSEQTRVALLPADTIYGWQFYSWGAYRGIGFYWFGLRQPILARAFDVWSREDENFYRELFYARYQEQADVFKRVLQKYDVRYLLLDSAIFMPRKQQYNYPQVWRDLIAQVPECRQVFHQEFLSLYDCGSQESFVAAPASYTFAPTQPQGVFADLATQVLETPAYVSEAALSRSPGAGKNIDVYWPWAYLYQQEIDPNQVQIESVSSDISRLTWRSYRYGDGEGLNIWRQLFLPAHQAEKISFYLQVQYRQDHYRLIFSPTIEAVFDERTQALYADIAIDLPPLPSGSEPFYLDFGTQHVLLSEQTAPQLYDLERLDTNQVWTIFPQKAAKIDAAGTMQVQMSQARSIEVAADTWRQYRHSAHVAVPLGTKQVSLRTLATSLRLTGSIFPHGINCDSLQRGSYSKRVDAGIINYVAAGFASSCDTFIHQKMDISRSSYLLHLHSANLQGWPIHYYLWDSKAKVALWENLLVGRDHQVLLNYLRAPSRAKNAELVLNIATRSLMGEQAHNQLLDTPTAYEVDSAYLAQIALLPAGAGQSTATNLQSALPQRINPLKVMQGQKLGISHYRVHIKMTPGISDAGLLALHQGFHSGWVAKIKGRLLPLKRLNSWANAWLISQQVCPDECWVEINFWPQQLGWWGLAVSLLASLAALLLLLLRRYSNYCHRRTCALPPVNYRQLKESLRRQFMGRGK